MTARGQERGTVLVLALWLIVLLSLLAFSAGSLARVEARSTARQLDRMREDRLCLAAVELAEQALREDPARACRDDQDRFRGVELEEGSFSIARPAQDGEIFGLEDEQGRLNLNAASPAELAALPGMDPGSAAAISDWRARKGGPLQSVEELRLVLPPEVFRAVRPWVTVYGDGRIDLNAAPSPVLRALGFSAEGAEALFRFRRGEDGREGTADDGAFRTVEEIQRRTSDPSFAFPAPDRARLAWLIADSRLSVTPSVFRVRLSVLRPRTDRREIVIGADPARRSWKILNSERSG